MFEGLKTFIGLAIAAVPSILPLFGLEVSAAFPQEAGEIVEQIITIAGLVIALYGRLVAKVPGWFVRK